MLRRSFLRLTSLLPAVLAVRNTLVAQQPQTGAVQGSDKSVVLLTVPIAGIQFGKFSRSDRFAELRAGQELRLTREPENKHDERAIAIRTLDGRMVGYVPMASNAIPSGLMDQGVILTCTITKLEFAQNPRDRAFVQLGICSQNIV